MAFGHEKLDSASEGMLCMRTMVNTGREKSTPIPIPTPTPKRRSADGRPVPKPPASGIPRDTALRSKKTEPKRKKCLKIRCVCPNE